jgi:hypothetical protein
LLLACASEATTGNEEDNMSGRFDSPLYVWITIWQRQLVHGRA